MFSTYLNYILKYLTTLPIDLNDPDGQLISSLDKYQSIRYLFFKFNTCLPSSAPVERLFSFAEIINAPRRNALSNQNWKFSVVEGKSQAKWSQVIYYYIILTQEFTTSKVNQIIIMFPLNVLMFWNTLCSYQ